MENTKTGLTYLMICRQHTYQYEDGIDMVPDDNELSPESVNIKLFAESLMDEKAQFESN